MQFQFILTPITKYEGTEVSLFFPVFDNVARMFLEHNTEISIFGYKDFFNKKVSIQLLTFSSTANLGEIRELWQWFPTQGTQWKYFQMLKKAIVCLGLCPKIPVVTEAI